MRNIRVSSGWAFENNFTMEEQQELASKTDGLELGISNEKRFNKYMNNKIKGESFSVHLLPPPDTQIAIAKKLNRKYNVETFVIHPEPSFLEIDQIIDKINTLSIPISIENLDSRFNKEKSEKLFLYGLNKMKTPVSTIDLQHLTEHYSLDNAKNFINKYAPTIIEFHVSSGSKNKPHTLIKKGENTEKIIQLLEYINQHPIVNDCSWIIEGRYKSIDEVIDEYTFLSKFEGKRVGRGSSPGF